MLVQTLISLHKVGKSLFIKYLSVIKPYLNPLFKDEQDSAAAQAFPILVKIRPVCRDWPVATECQILF